MSEQKSNLNRPNSVLRIPCSLSGSFFRYWFMFLRPFHKLTNREIDVITAFVKHRYELSKVIKDDVILDKVTMSEDVKKQVREECGIAFQHFQVIMSNLRKNKVIENGKINPKFIPNLNDSGSFKLLVYYRFND